MLVDHNDIYWKNFRFYHDQVTVQIVLSIPVCAIVWKLWSTKDTLY